jgi:hypothetical protein
MPIQSRRGAPLSGGRLTGLGATNRVYGFGRTGLGNVPIPGLGPEWSLGDPASDLWGASYYNGSKIMGTVANGPGGKPYWETLDVLYAAPWDQATEDAITAAANANFASPAHAAYAYDQMVAATTNPDMRAVLLNDEWRTHALAGDTVSWDMLSPTLQDLIKKVPNLYYSLTGQTDLMTAAPAPAPSTEPARYLINGVEQYADGTPVQGGYNALLDVYRQLGLPVGSYSPQVQSVIDANPGILSTLTQQQQAAYTAAKTAATTTTSSSSTAAALPSSDVQPAGTQGGGDVSSAPIAFSSANDAGTTGAAGSMPVSGSSSGAPFGAGGGTSASGGALAPSSTGGNGKILAAVAVAGVVALYFSRRRK